ncbi:M81 family metallopeptidase [Teichococcus oryzae]|uniref:M81 family metallopeptidase n=1 Tax=Teichococcus oryzae TaxID=1608942 RepID=A0A5B2TII1_9PROT|nr:M81 family metallopeptidase [Pseudoroseomonas oryzae]KAA2214281.1 M81 family metallopeptidase [Pseudoroseomonas oryzae]
MRIAVLKFSHETVTFLPFDTTEDDFVFPGSPASGEALLGSEPGSYIGGFVQVAREYDGVELVGIESPLDSKRGSGSGWITTQAFERFVGRMVEELRAQGPFDGVYLSLHGAMGVRGVPRPEAEIARRVREAVGPKALITATFDPHGNEDEEFLRHADMAFTVKYYPHYDAHLQGQRAARMLVRAIRGDFRPSHVTVKVPIISPTVLQWTGGNSPWAALVQRALVWEAREPDVYVNVFFGFPWSDVPDVGMCFQVITDNRPDLARAVADDMAGFAWRQREALLNAAKIWRIDQGVSRAAEAVAEGRTPVVLCDHSDRSGYATWLLRAILDQGLKNTLVATLADAGAVEKLLAGGIKAGDPFDMAVGGLADESSGEPVRIQGRVRQVVEGPRRASTQTCISIEFGEGNLLVLTPFLTQIIELHTLRDMGIDPATFDVIAIKSRVHFRRGFDDNGFAREILLVEPDQPFLGTVRLDGLRYEHVTLGNYYPHGNPAFG